MLKARLTQTGLFCAAIFTASVWAAPIPGTSSSPLVSAQSGLFRSQKGFKIHSGDTDWRQISPPSRIPSLVTIYQSPIQGDGDIAALTVRVDELRTASGLKNYVKKWMQDYTRFGFDVLTAKPIKVNQQSAFLLDIVSKETKKQLRQVVLVKDKTAVILTCRDARATFAKAVQDCNQIIKTFEWTSDSVKSTID